MHSGHRAALRCQGADCLCLGVLCVQLWVMRGGARVLTMLAQRCCTLCVRCCGRDADLAACMYDAEAGAREYHGHVTHFTGLTMATLTQLGDESAPGLLRMNTALEKGSH